MSAGAPGRRYLSLVLPRLPTDLVERRLPPAARDDPRAVVAMEKNALRLVAVNAAAEALGLAPGLALADARACHPGLEVSEAAPEEAARMLAHLADACERYTPLIGLDGADGLLLDVTGCAHLFGGENGLVRDLLRRVAAAGLSGRAALVATPGAAFALARFAAGRDGVVAPAEEDLAALLAPLPLGALRLDGAAVEALARLGFRRVGDLYGRPRAPLAARFGMDLLRRLDTALGHAPVAVDYRFPPPVFCAERSLPEPVERVEDVLGLAVHLASPLARALERHGMGARRLDLALFRVDGQVTRLSIGTSRPIRDPQVVRRLFAEKVAALSGLDPGFGFELVRLSVREAAPLATVQEGLGAADGAGAEALDALVDRLATRFGTDRVQRLVLQDRHVPEEACAEVPAQSIRGWAEAALALEALRQATQEAEGRMHGQGTEGRAAKGGDASGGSEPACLLPWPRPAPRPLSPAGESLSDAEAGAGPWTDDAAPAASLFPRLQSRFGKEGGSGKPSVFANTASGPRHSPEREGRGEAAGEPSNVRFLPGRALSDQPRPRFSAARGEARGAGWEDRTPGAGLEAGALRSDEVSRPAASRAAIPAPETTGGPSAGTGGEPAPEAGPLPGRRPAAEGEEAPGGAGGVVRAEQADLAGPARPLRLVEPPEPVEAVAEVPDGPPIRFRWRRVSHAVVLAEGPERVAAEWWRSGSASTRDYFRVETEAGHRFWLFRAGLYGQETDRPAWFVHGLFG